MRRHPVATGLCLVALWGSVVASGCTDSVGLRSTCAYGRAIVADSVPACLQQRQLISRADRDNSLLVLTRAATLRDSLRAAGAAGDFYRAVHLTRVLAQVAEFYSRSLFADSARFHRMIDHVSVTAEFVQHSFSLSGTRVRSPATPYLVWYTYPGQGAYFQPVTTIETMVPLLPRPDAPLDSLVQVADHVYRYALWRSHGGVAFPVWEYEFTWTSGGITQVAPWISGMAQGEAVMMFAECYRRTHDPRWLARALETLRSMQVSWDDGGVLLPDTSHGYWWEEFHPVVRVWNGAAQALIGVGYLWSTTNDTTAKRMFDRGVDALKAYTPLYDTGTWTLYSATQGYNSIAYHHFEVAELDVLFTLTGDPWFQQLADRWRSYVPPPGVD